MQLTVDEKEKGGLASIKAYVEAGATPEQVKAFIDALDAPDEDDDQPQAVAAEKRGRMVTLPTGHQIVLEVDGGFTLPGKYSPETQRAIVAYMREHPLVAEATVVQELTTDGLPVPGGGGRSAEQQLVDLMTEGRAPKGGLSSAAERMQERAQGSAALTIGGMPVPDDTLSLEEARNAAIIGDVVRTTKFSGQWAVDDMPLPQ